MENEVMQEIIDFATEKLNSAYGFCGVGSGDNVAMINSSDGEGNDIKITFKVELELEPE